MYTILRIQCAEAKAKCTYSAAILKWIPLQFLVCITDLGLAGPHDEGHGDKGSLLCHLSIYITSKCPWIYKYNVCPLPKAPSLILIKVEIFQILLHWPWWRGCSWLSAEASSWPNGRPRHCHGDSKRDEAGVVLAESGTRGFPASLWCPKNWANCLEMTLY